jgi:hypothetical protein
MLPSSQGMEGSGLMLRTMSFNIYEQSDITDHVHAEYGMSTESVDYMQHTSRISPFARVSADLGWVGTLVVAYSDGGRPDELTEHSLSKNAEPENLLDEDLAEPVNALAHTPQISERDGRLQLQRTQNSEAGYTKTIGTRTYSVSGFYEHVSNGRMNVSGDLASLNAASLLSDGVSTTSFYNIGRYQRTGYIASVDQRLGEHVAVQAAYGRIGAVSASDIALGTGNLSTSDHNIAALGVRARIPKSGTRISAHYGWADPHQVIPQHTFTTQNLSFAPGLNIAIRQPLPSMFGWPGHLELTGDLRNLLSQGYLPIGAGGQQLLIVEAPKAIRGGLSITF